MPEIRRERVQIADLSEGRVILQDCAIFRRNLPKGLVRVAGGVGDTEPSERERSSAGLAK